MSYSLFEKLKNRQQVSAQDWDRFYSEVHAESPHMTPDAFDEHRASSGKNSYEILAVEVKTSDRLIVDLGCGDGHLVPFLLKKTENKCEVIGVDLSSVELDHARKNIENPRVRFVQENATQLSIESGTVDLIVSHLAFMLMLPAEKAVAEILRVLRPGGRFATIVFRPDHTDPLFSKIVLLIQEFYEEEFNVKIPPMGDPRARTKDGVAELFGSDFSEIRSEDFDLDIFVPRSDALTLWKDMYYIGMLPEGPKTKLRDKIGEYFDSISKEGKVRYPFPMRKLSLVKR